MRLKKYWTVFSGRIAVIMIIACLYERFALFPLHNNRMLSSILFWCLVAFFAMTTVFIEPLTKTTPILGTAASALLPVEIYAVLSWVKFRFSLLLASSIASCILVILLSYLMIVSNRCKKRKTHLSVFLQHWYSSLRIVIAVCFLLFLIPTSVLSTTTLPVYRSEPAKRTDAQTQYEQLWSESTGSMHLLAEEEWEQLDYQQRIDVLQTVSDLECSNLGIPTHPTVAAALLEDETLGCYSEETNTIYINIQFLICNGSVVMVHTTLHEVAHCYQHVLVRLYDEIDTEELKGLSQIKPAAAYKEEFEHYISTANGTYEEYAAQACEQDADQYADQRILVYIEYCMNLDGYVIATE